MDSLTFPIADAHLAEARELVQAVAGPVRGLDAGTWKEINLRN